MTEANLIGASAPRRVPADRCKATGTKARFGRLLAAVGSMLLLVAASRGKDTASVTVPVVLDHNRMLVAAEIQRTDGSWRTVRLWIDTGNPSFYISQELARDLGIDLLGATENTEVPPPTGVRIGGMPLDFRGVRSEVMFAPRWLFGAMHNDANLPSTVLQRYQVVFDYPKRELTMAKPGSLKPRGVRSSASVNPETGIIQIDALIDGNSLSFALDSGASYSFMSGDVLALLSRQHPNWPRITGVLGCANMWGWWPPQEQTLPVMRLPEILWGSTRLTDVGMVGVSEVSPGGPALGTWYSQKTARPVGGFLGPNAFKAFRVEIDYANSAVYFEKGAAPDSHDMDLVGLTLRPEANGNYRVIGVAERHGRPAVAGVEPGDVLLHVGDLETTGATMGTVVDALRGKPGEIRILVLERGDTRLRIEAKVERFL